MKTVEIAHGIKFPNLVGSSFCIRMTMETTITYRISENAIPLIPMPLQAYWTALAINRAKIWKGSVIRVPHKNNINTEIIPARSSLLILNHDA